MSIRLSCGHYAPDLNDGFGISATWPGLTRECEPCEVFGNICEKCFVDYEAVALPVAPAEPTTRVSVVSLVAP